MFEKDRLIELIKNNPTVQRYQKLEKWINDNQELKNQMAKLKKIQQHLVRATAAQKNTISLQKAYDEALEALLEFPLIDEYFALQGDINDMLQQIVYIFEKGLDE
jgi:cell fate (sporulation/competence/biofilm development) regulator YmcA (YheA/YmcA/DUF963 family)